MTETAEVGFWAAEGDEGIEVYLGSESDWEDSSAVQALPLDMKDYLREVIAFVEEELDGDALFGGLPREDPVLLATFTIDEDGEVLEHSVERDV